MLYSGKYQLPPVDKETFRTLAMMSSCNVLMLTHDGYYQQTNGLAMGSPPAPHLPNGWLSQHDDRIKGYVKLFSRYMDDILRSIRKDAIEDTLGSCHKLCQGGWSIWGGYENFWIFKKNTPPPLT